ncbi:MAG TPA: hypothetical protein DCZ95_07875 [Verrucomicrobia bacterium]|nr:hypothetical protein [Verrucomicrobiota bacterium]
MKRDWGRSVAGFALCTVALSTLAGADQQAAKTEAVDSEVYRQFMSGQVSETSDLDLWFKCEQFNWLPLALPDETGASILRQPSGQVLPFDAKTFAPGFMKKLPLHYLNTVPSYRLWLVEDRASRSTLFYNEKGDLVLTLPPEPGYSPRWFLQETRPDLFSGPYTPWYVDSMTRMYDPARVALEVTIVPSAYAQDYLYVESRLAAEAAKQALASGSGGGALMRYSGPPVSNLTITAIERRTNAVRVTVAYPNDYTNGLAVFHTDDLLDFWWELGTTTNINPATNWIEWTDLGVTNMWATPRMYACGSDIDTDGDGFWDSAEILRFHSDPQDPLSKPVNVSGSISYNGIETGTVYALAVAVEDGWPLGCSASRFGPGGYTNNEVAVPRSYWFKSFLDVNNNHSRDLWEPSGIFSASSTSVTSNLAGVDIPIQDVPSLWGALSYSGPATGNVYVVAVPSSNSFDSIYRQTISWEQGSETQTGGVIYLSFPACYSFKSLPASNYWIRAFIDEDYDGEFTVSDPAGQYSAQSIPVSNRLTGINITLAFDADGDGMADGWEMLYGNLSDSAADPDGDGLSNLQESLFGTNPLDPDTDQDGLSDEEETTAGLDPFYNPLSHRLASLTFAYDDQDRLERVESPASSLTMGYDAAANLTNAVCSKGE